MSRQLFTFPVFWHLKDDGAEARCKECKQHSHLNNLLLIQTPNGTRSLLHRNCIDNDWFKSAKDLGEFNE